MAGEGERPKQRGLRELRQRLAEVEVEERAAQELEQLQFQLDGMQQKLFQIDDTLKGVERLRVDQQKATHELSLLPVVTQEAVAQVQRLPQLIQKRDDTLKRIADERATLEGDGTAAPTLASLGQDRMFVGAISIGAGSVAAAVIGSGFNPDLRMLALLDIPGFGLAVLRACQHISQVRKQQGVGRQLSLLTDRESRTNKAFDSELRDAKALMKQLGVETVGEARGAPRHPHLPDGAAAGGHRQARRPRARRERAVGAGVPGADPAAGHRAGGQALGLRRLPARRDRGPARSSRSCTTRSRGSAGRSRTTSTWSTTPGGLPPTPPPRSCGPRPSSSA